MAVGETPNRESVLESITVVFANSKLKDVVGTDALKSVLAGQYRELVVGKTLHLQVIWDLLEDQPDFDAKDAIAPFSVLKTWESELGLTVNVPKALKKYSATEFLAQASHCPVPKAQKARAINPSGARAKARETMAGLERTGTSNRSDEVSTRKPALEAVLGLVAIIGLAYGGYTFYGTMGGAEFKALEASQIRGDLPIAKAKQLGDEVNLLINDDTWYELPAAARSEALTTALDGMQTRNIKSLIVQDSSGAVRASAQWIGTPAAIAIRLY
jgi:hypothetical protein